MVNHCNKAGAPSVMHRVTSSLSWILENLEAEGSGLCPREAEPSPHCVTVAGFSFLPEKAQSKLGCRASSMKHPDTIRCSGWDALHISVYSGWSQHYHLHQDWRRWGSKYQRMPYWSSIWTRCYSSFLISEALVQHQGRQLWCAGGWSLGVLPTYWLLEMFSRNICSKCLGVLPTYWLLEIFTNWYILLVCILLTNVDVRLYIWWCNHKTNKMLCFTVDKYAWYFDIVLYIKRRLNFHKWIGQFVLSPKYLNWYSQVTS